MSDLTWQAYWSLEVWTSTYYSAEANTQMRQENALQYGPVHFENQNEKFLGRRRPAPQTPPHWEEGQPSHIPRPMYSTLGACRASILAVSAFDLASINPNLGFAPEDSVAAASKPVGRSRDQRGSRLLSSSGLHVDGAPVDG